ncbi:hypothetical protein D3C75_740590 [compost metagenome]
MAGHRHTQQHHGRYAHQTDQHSHIPDLAGTFIEETFGDRGFQTPTQSIQWLRQQKPPGVSRPSSIRDSLSRSGFHKNSAVGIPDGQSTEAPDIPVIHGFQQVLQLYSNPENPDVFHLLDIVEALEK